MGSYMPTSQTSSNRVKKKEATEFMSKAEVCELLGKSKRTVETFVSRGRLGVGYFAGANGKTAQFRRAEVEALKRELETPFYRPAPVTSFPEHEHSATSVVRVASADPLAGLAAHLARLATAYPSPASEKPWLTLDEAAAWSGLPKGWLLAEAKAGNSFARNASKGARASWRFNRELLKRG
jgi:hypothetical protein